MKKIIDQYTDRTDLTRHQKWRLRHLEQWRKIHAGQMEAWRSRYPEKDEAIQKRFRKKKKIKKVNAFIELRSRYVLANTKYGCGKRREIIELHKKGKSLANICIWLKLPMSAVCKVVEEAQSLQKPLDDIGSIQY